MALALTTFTGNGTVGPYSISWPYLNGEHVHVFVDGVEVGYSFLSASSIELDDPAANGASGVIRRITPNAAPLVDWANGANINEENLDLQTLQLLYIMQEAEDAVDQALSLDPLAPTTWDAESKRIKNVANPSVAQDAATKTYVDTKFAADLEAVDDDRVAAEAAAAAAAATAATLAGALGEQYVVAAAAASLTAERVGTSGPHIVWDFGTPGQAKLALANPVTGALQFDVSGVNDFDSDMSQHEVFSSGDTQTNIAATVYSNNMGGGTFHCKYARGSKASPLPVLAGDFVGGYGSRAWHSGGAWQISSPASIHWIATENQGPSNYGMCLRFLTNPKGTNVRQERVVITDNGTLWAHDTGVYDFKSETQTKPFSDVQVLGSTSASVGSAGCSVGSVHYGGSGVPIPGFRGGGARGTAAAPSAIQTNDFLCFLGGHGYGDTAWSPGSRGLVGIKAAENWSDAAQGTYAVIETTPTGSTARAERMRADEKGNVTIGTAALATNATDGFLYIPTCAGTPTGTPTAKTGRAPLVIDSTNNKLYFYSGGAWRDAGP